MQTKEELNEGLIAFLKASPTAFHAVAEMKKFLSSRGFRELAEGENWEVQPGGRYYVTRNGSSLIAFTVGPKDPCRNFQIAAAHTDSPAFKLKEKAELCTAGKYTRLNTEGYGGMICSSWLDRPLSIAGRVMTREADGSIRSRLLKIDRNLLLIPNVAIHMNRKVNEGVELNKQVDMLPLLGGNTEEGALVRLIAKELSVRPEDILGSDLFLYNRETPAIWGIGREYISAPHLDDLQCAYAILTAIAEGKRADGINVAAFFDNEEVGSGTKQGADSTLLPDVLRRLSFALGLSESEYLRALASGYMISADNAHAVHPNHPEHTDANNCTYINEGVVVKSHAGQKYTSDGASIAILRELAHRAEVPLQYFANRSDKAGGSTLGNIAAAHVSIPCVDVGLPQLAMHSSYETAGTGDTLHLVRLLGEFYATSIQTAGDGCFALKK